MENRERYAHVRSKSRYLAFTEPPLLKWSCQPERIEPERIVRRDRAKEPFQPLFFCFSRKAYGTRCDLGFSVSYAQGKRRVMILASIERLMAS